ncbi:TIR domain-containing protein [Kaarinaea lacus]
MGKGTKDNRLDELKRLIDDIEAVRIKPRMSPKFKSWHRETLETLERLFGRKSRQVKDFEAIRYNLASFSNKTPESKFEEAFLHGLMNAAVMLSSAVKELQVEEPKREPNIKPPEAIEPEPILNTPAFVKPAADPVTPAVRAILNASSAPAAKEPPAIVKRAMAVAGHKIFLLYANDLGMKDELSTFLSKVEISPIVLKESAASSVNLIDELERYDDVEYGIVMLNPDASGISESTVYELGLIVGKLGRNRVCGLVKNQIDILANYSGVSYVPVDPAGAWKFLLIKQLKDAGFDVDANLAL